ncbi:hypothetical protein [Actinoplanes sp. NPDC051851]|uniref:hypothetical protein n=1 Tax=Actinoplanes sp. NPDC051851 TaxID=3154753 RepID=UPI00343BF03B
MASHPSPAETGHPARHWIALLDPIRNRYSFLATMAAIAIITFTAIMALVQLSPSAYLSPGDGATVDRCGTVFRVRATVPPGSRLVQSLRADDAADPTYATGFVPSPGDPGVQELTTTVGGPDDGGKGFTAHLYLSPVDAEPPTSLTSVPDGDLHLTRRPGPANCPG